MAPIPERLSTLEEKVINHIRFFWVVSGSGLAWLVVISVLLFNINGKLGLTVRQSLPQQLETLAETPANPKSQDEARKLLNTAKEKSIAVPSTVVESVGKKFIDTAPNQENAWNTGLDFVSYRTSLNADLIQVLTANQIATERVDDIRTTYYKMLFVNGYPHPHTSVGGEVPIDRAALMHPLDEPSQNEHLANGDQVILVQDGALQLDGYIFKNVVIRNAIVFYSGGPLRLENVIFVNCTFVMKNELPQRNFADAVLSEPTTTFST